MGDTVFLSPNAFNNVHICVHFAKGSIFLDGPGDAIVLECLMFQMESKFPGTKQSFLNMLLLQNARVLRSDATFAEVAKLNIPSMHI